MLEENNLALKYRPTTFRKYVGNGKLKENLLKVLRVSEDELPKAMMFVGPSGCGKTTAARLVAKYYMCQGRDEGDPCDRCAMCSVVDEYITTGDTDKIEYLREIDVAQDRGIANMDAIKADMMEPSFDGSWKIYIFDEFHASSYPAQNALLKILEDTPERVLLIFCTTDESRVLATVKGRLDHIYHVTKPTGAELAAHLATICQREGIKYDKAGLLMLAKVSAYQVRDAIRNLKIVITESGEVTAGTVAKAFSVLTMDYAERFFRCWKNKDLLSGLELLSLIKKNYELTQFYDVLEEYILRGIYVMNGVQVDGINEDEMKHYRVLFKNMAVPELMQVLTDLRNAYPDGIRYGKTTNRNTLELNFIYMFMNGIHRPVVVTAEQAPMPEKPDTVKPIKFATKKLEEDTQKTEYLSGKKGAVDKGTDDEKTFEEMLEELKGITSIRDNLHLFTHVYKIKTR